LPVAGSRRPYRARGRRPLRLSWLSNLRHHHRHAHLRWRRLCGGRDGGRLSIIQEVIGGTEVVDGGGRIRARWQENDVVRAYRGLYDRNLAVPCRSVQTRGGRFFCAPEGMSSIGGASTYRTACGINVGHSIPGSLTAFEARQWTLDAAGRQFGDSVLRCGPNMTTGYLFENNVCQMYSIYTCSNVPIESMGWGELAFSLDEEP
jgi:hypothetical protein